MKKKGAEIITDILEMYGIQHIAGIPGGSNLPIYHALSKSRINHILARHEQGACFIAQGIARSTGKVGVCIATSGPGATNFVTALSDAKSDSVPVIAITGQVPQNMIGTDAFQEVDICSIAKTIVKKAYQIKDVSEISAVMHQAFHLATSGKPGPVLIDIPKDIQIAETDFYMGTRACISSVEEKTNWSEMNEIIRMIHESKQPVIYAGGGIIHAGASELLHSFAMKSNIPVATTLMALGSFPSGHLLHLGIPGMHGSRCTNMLLDQTDLLLAFGVRFDDRVTGIVHKFCPHAKIIHIDIDRKEIGKIKHPEIGLKCDIRKFLEIIIPLIREQDRPEWINTITYYKQQFGFKIPPVADVTHPVNLIRAIQSFTDEDTIITTDVGQHQMWVAQYYSFRKPRTLLTSGGQGTMGFGLPTAIGAAIANPDKQVIAFCGDGSVLMNIQELATLADTNANVCVIIMNNGQLGLVRQQQELFYDRNYFASTFKTRVDFAAVARGFGIQAFDLSESSNPEVILEKVINAHGPRLINVPLEAHTNVMPMVPPGASNIEAIDHHEINTDINSNEKL